MGIKCFVLIILFAGKVIHSQTFFMTITPEVSSFYGTYKNKITTHNSEFLVINNKSKLGSITFGGLSTGLNIDFIKYKKMEFGLSYSVAFATVRSGFYYYSQPSSYVYFNNLDGNHVDIESYNVFQFGARIGIPVFNKKQRSSKVTITLYYQYKKKTAVPEFNDLLGFKDGYIVVDQIPTAIYNYNRKSVALNFRYDLIIKTKRAKNLFGLFISYNQGFRNMGVSHFNYFHIQKNYKYEVTAISKASGIFLGITKPISINLKNGKKD